MLDVCFVLDVNILENLNFSLSNHSLFMNMNLDEMICKTKYVFILKIEGKYWNFIYKIGWFIPM